MSEMDRRNFLKYLLGGAAALTFDWGSLPDALAGGHERSVVILGIDGMDPRIVERLVSEGRLPTFRRLMREGSFSPLGTTIPPQSPVAWSSFITGHDPGGHGIFDFVHRNPEDYTPAFSLSHVDEPPRVITLGEWTIPVSPGKAVLLRKGVPFWRTLDRGRVPYHIYKIPADFPPSECDGETLSGLGTPDLLGTYGTFSFYTDDPQFSSMRISGGAIYPVTVRGGTVEAELLGPGNTVEAFDGEVRPEQDGVVQDAIQIVGDQPPYGAGYHRPRCPARQSHRRQDGRETRAQERAAVDHRCSTNSRLPGMTSQ